MKPFVFIFISLFPIFLKASDSSILRDMMGREIFEKSGLGTLDQEQLDVLEDWILDNSIMGSSSQTEVEKVSPQPESANVTIPSTKKAGGFFRRTVGILRRDKGSRENEDQNETERSGNRNEPVTQKYVIVDSMKEKKLDIEPDLIRSRIDGPFRGWRGNKTRFRLENGEIWEQRQSSTFLVKLDSPEVIIKKGRFGYTMEVPSIGKRVHVKQIK